MTLRSLLASCLLVLPLAGAIAPGTAAAEPAACEQRRGVLGVSRVVEVDTSTGPRFGNMQYKDIDFLRPGEVVLTFDDGPLRSKTLEVLNALERHCTKAIFFMVGRMAVSDPAMVREIARRGHTVGTHTWSHKNLGRQSQSGAIKEIELGVSAISAALGEPVAPFFRFPYLSDPNSMIAYLKDREMGNFSIDIDSVDFRTRSGATVVNRVMSRLKAQGKGILLFHDIQRSTAAGIENLLDELAAGGYKVVHMVSKHPVTTIKEYDEIAAKEMERRAKSVAERPLSARSVVWPVSTGAELPPTEVLANLRPEPAAPRASNIQTPDPKPAGIGARVVSDSSPAPAENEARPEAGSSGRAVATQAAPRDKPDWREEVFRN